MMTDLIDECMQERLSGLHRGPRIWGAPHDQVMDAPYVEITSGKFTLPKLDEPISWAPSPSISASRSTPPSCDAWRPAF